MTKKVFTLLICLVFATLGLHAQKSSWKTHVKTAEKLVKDARFGDAAEEYENAWRKKTTKVELIQKAAEYYYIVKDYRKAAKAYSNIKDMSGKYPLAGLKYARCLKQDAQYDLAKVELVNFLSNYKGDDADVLQQIVQTEIKGCDLAMELAKKTVQPLELEHLSNSINTPETEFAPMPFADDILYFSSTMATKARIYRSQRKEGVWSKAKLPENFPVIKDEHYCNGTLSPDAQRFYFTMCKSTESWGNLSTRCEIYVIKRQDNEWTTPTPLPEYINLPEITTTHPSIIHTDDKEILYFSSNREGGYGGMDIWYATRSLSSNALDFTFPENAGGKINTIGDEITPFYINDENTLYFASNGHVSLGGFDVMSSKGSEKKWEKSVNLKTPVNSSADDYFYVKTPSGTGGYFVSNRLFGMEKITTRHEDIFSFTERTKDIVAQGSIYDKEDENIVNNALVSLYDISDDSRERLLTNKNVTDGRYFFPLIPNRKYKIEVSADNFEPSSFMFNTFNFTTITEYGEPIYLTKMGSSSMANNSTTVTTTPPVTSTPSTTTPSNTTATSSNTYTSNDRSSMPTSTSGSSTTTTNSSSTTTYTPPATTSTTTTRYEPSTSSSSSAVTTTPSTYTPPVDPNASYTTRGTDNYKVVTSAPRHSGTYYKVQIIALANHSESHSRYNGVRDMARMDTEYIVDRKLTRVLLADYFSYDDAKYALEQAQYNGFPGAFIIKYEDGERIERVR